MDQRPQVNCCSLDDYAGEHLKRVDVVHADTYGCEANILLGAFATIRDHRPVVVMRTCDAPLRKAGFCAHYVFQWLKALGYSPMRTDGRPYATFEELGEEAEVDPYWAPHAVFVPRKPDEAAEGGIVRKDTNDGPEPLQQRDIRSMRCVVAYTADKGRYMDKLAWTRSWLGRLRGAGFSIEEFCLNIEGTDRWLEWPRLDRRWRGRDRHLLDMYERLSGLLADNDVLIHIGGANLHPDFVTQLPSFNVVSYNDDPEGSEIQSRFTCAAYDSVFVGNAGCLDMYRSRGIENVAFWAIGVHEGDYDNTLTEDAILSGARELPIVFLGEQDAHRDHLLCPLMKQFPETAVHGYGWPDGFLPYEQQASFYANSRIGWSMDQSVGPATSRTYRVPANGVLLIGNNSAHLGNVYKLGEEAIGFDTIEECTEYTHYYLAHEQERREIAVRGWQRTMTDYRELPLWEQLLSTIKPHLHT